MMRDKEIIKQRLNDVDTMIAMMLDQVDRFAEFRKTPRDNANFEAAVEGLYTQVVKRRILAWVLKEDA